MLTPEQRADIINRTRTYYDGLRTRLPLDEADSDEVYGQLCHRLALATLPPQRPRDMRPEPDRIAAHLAQVKAITDDIRAQARLRGQLEGVRHATHYNNHRIMLVTEADLAKVREKFDCTCDPADLFDPPDPRPRAVEDCPAHRARRAAQLAQQQPDEAPRVVP